jgi:type IV pilus assembly protein PilC
MATAVAAKSPIARSSISQLKTFTWVGTDKRGVKLKGEETGKNENLVKAELRKRGVNPSQVKEKRDSIFGKTGSKITPKEIAIFARQIATMMQSGVPVVQSFDIIAGSQKNPRMKDMLNAIRNDIEGGSSLAEALGKHPVQFDELFTNLVRAGESAGVLDTVLSTVADYKERIEAIKGKIKKALFYPTAVVAVALVVCFVLLVYVVPVFDSTFKNFGAELPAFTQMIINLSRFMTAWWWLILLAIGAAFATFIFFYKRSHDAQAAGHRANSSSVGMRAFCSYVGNYFQGRCAVS